MEDSRTSSFLHFLQLLKEVPRPPEMILLENVAGFESSLARERLLEVLDARNYRWQVCVVLTVILCLYLCIKEVLV